MNEAYNCDCLDYMKTLPDNAFDLACVDPPFGSGLTEGGGLFGSEASCTRAEAVTFLWRTSNE